MINVAFHLATKVTQKEVLKQITVEIMRFDKEVNKVSYTELDSAVR